MVSFICFIYIKCNALIFFETFQIFYIVLYCVFPRIGADGFNSVLDWIGL